MCASAWVTRDKVSWKVKQFVEVVDILQNLSIWNYVLLSTEDKELPSSSNRSILFARLHFRFPRLPTGDSISLSSREWIHNSRRILSENRQLLPPGAKKLNSGLNKFRRRTHSAAWKIEVSTLCT